MPVKRKQIERPSPSTEFEVTEHWIGGTVPGGALNLVASAAGGTASFLAGSANTPGIARFNTAGTATGSYMLRGLNTALLVTGNAQHNYYTRFRFRLPQAGISTTDTFNVVLGFGNINAAGEPGSGVYFYIDTVENMQYFVCKNTAGRTAIANVVHPANKWLEVGITMQRNGIARFEMQTAEDSNIFASASFGDNFPLNTGVNMSLGILKTGTGVNNRNLDLDYATFGFNSYPPPLLG